MTVDNRRHDGDTGDLTFGWVHEVDGRAVASGVLAVPPVAAGDSTSVPIPTLDRGAAGEHWLTVTAALADRTPWATAGHVVTTAQLPLGVVEPGASAAPVAAPEPAVPSDDGGYALGEARFDRWGRLLSVGPLPALGGEVTLWRAPTENDSLATRGSYELADPAETMGLGVDGPSSAERWREAGLDRLQPRLVALVPGPDGLTTRYLLAAANSAQHLTVEQRWRWSAGTLQLDVDVQPSAGWTVTWPRVGVHLRLPAGYAEASWFGTGPGENYADSRVAARVGRFSAAVDDLTVRYAVPQESGHREALRELRLAGEGLPSFSVTTTPCGRGPPRLRGGAPQRRGVDGRPPPPRASPLPRRPPLPRPGTARPRLPLVRAGRPPRTRAVAASGGGVRPVQGRPRRPCRRLTTPAHRRTR